MNSLGDSNFTICKDCNRKVTSHLSQYQICLRQVHSSQKNQKNKSNVTATRSIQTNQVNKYENKLFDTSGNSKLDEFIKETQNNSKYCDDFIEWIPNNYLENVKYLAKGGNSNIFCGTWNLTIPLAIKAIGDSDEQFLNEFKMHHKCRSQSVIPFYGVTKVPERNEYAMVIRRAKYGDLRNYIRKFFPKLTWADRIEILINISKALKHIHEMNLIHRDFHCKNILVDENRCILISDFGLCTPVDLEIVSDKIQGVLPYIAPEVLKRRPYTKQSEVYSLSMIMWELTSNESPFSDDDHDKFLAMQIIKERRPVITKETPNFYASIMKQCWDPDPLKRPDSFHLPELFEEMMDLCKNLKYDTVSPNFSLFRNIERKTEPETETKSLGYTLSITSFDFTKNDDEVVNDDIKSSPQYNLPTDSKEKSARPEYEIKTNASEYTTSISPIDFSESIVYDNDKFPENYFYLGISSISHVYVLDVERAFIFFGFVKEGSKTIITSQKSESDNDAPYQLWRHENGYIVNKQTNLYLEVDNGKVGNHIILRHQKPVANGANQRWILTKERYIALKSHPKYVIDVKGTKEGSHVVLSDSSSKSFAKSNSAKWEIVSLSKKRRNEGATGIIRLELIEAKGLKSVDSFLAGGKPDPYVRVFHEGSQDIIAQTKFINNNLNPVWNEVHYLPVKNIGDEFILDGMDYNNFTKDKPLGRCTFEVTKELVKEVSANVFEGTPNGIDKWANLSIQGKLHYRAKFFPLTLSALPKPTPDFLANLKEKPFDKSTFYILITLQAPNGSFPPSNTLTSLFGYSDTEELFNLYKNHVHDERVVNNTNKTIWTTSMVLWFLRYLLKEHRSEWGNIYERSERYITKELGGDLKIEEIVIAGGRKAVRERFEIKVVDDKQIITRENVKAHDITRIIRHQTSIGSFQASDELALLMSFNNSGQLRTALTRHINSQSKSNKITNYETQVWVPILVLYYFRLVGVDHKTEWEESYLRAYKWLWVQFKGKEKIEQEAFKLIESFVKERYSVKEEVMQLDEQFIIYIADKIDFIKKGGVSVSRGISAKKLHGVARIHIVSAKNLMKADSWFGGGASDPYVKIIGLSSGEVYGETRVVYNNINPEWNQVFYIPIYDLNDKIKLQNYDCNAFFKHVTLGSYVLDLKDFIKVLSNGAVTGKKLDTTCELRPNKGKLHYIADFHSYSEQDYTTTIISKTTITIQHLYILITYLRPDGGFELNDILSKLLNFNTKDELVKSFTAYIEKENDDRVKALHIDTWGTALITAFLKTLLWEHRLEWMTTYTKAETYLSEIVTDIETEERLYTLANRFVIERFKFTEWESEEQKKSLGIIVQSKKIIITRRNVTIRHVRRFLSYQKESGCFELDNHLAETLGFSSAEEAKKSLETHFSSYSKVSKLDVNLHCSAIMIWFIRYVLVDFRGEWVDKYQTTSKWITEQVKDKQTEEELLEAARSFVRKRFDVDDEALKDDETFESTLALTPENIPSDIKRQIEEDEIKNENDAIVTDQVIGLLKIKIKGARNLPKSSSWFTSSKPDPYIKILDASGQEIVRTRTISETIEPKWEEVHYVSIHGTGESITFEIMGENLFITDKPLGTYVFETAKIIKKSEEGSYATSEPVREWFPLVISKKASGELDMEVQFVSTQYSWSESFIFKKETLTIEHIYIILSWKNTRGYFEFSDDVAHFFNYKSQEELKSDFLKLITEFTELQSLSESALSTALVITYLKVLCWKYREEWKKVSANIEEWLSSEINHIELEDKLYEICEKFIIEKFNVKDIEEEQKIVLISSKKRVIITRKLVTIRIIRRILAYQTQGGNIPLNNKTAELLGFENTEDLKKELQTYFKNENVKKVEHLWASACIIWYLRYVALDYRNDWLESFEKTSEYLRVQCNDSKLEKEVLDCAIEFIRKRYQVDNESVEVDNKFAVTLSRKKELIAKEKEEEAINEAKVKRKPSLLVKPAVTIETVKKYIKCQNKEGKFTFNDDIAKQLTFENSESFKTSIHKHFDSKLTSKLDLDTLTTAVSIYYLRLVSSKHRSEWSSTYESSCKWLKQQINNEEVERELLKSAKSYVIITYNVDDETIDTDSKEFSVIPAVPEGHLAAPEEEKAESTTEGILQVAKQTTEGVSEVTKYTTDTVSSTLINLKSKTTPETSKKIVENQKLDGSIKLDKTVSDQIKISSDNIQSSVQIYGASDRLLSVPKSVWETALSLRYLTITSQSQNQLKEQSEKAKQYLLKELKDEKLVDELLTTSEKIIVEQSVKKEKEDAISTIQSSTTTEKAKEIISSSQMEDGSLELTDTVSKELDVESKESLVSSTKTYFINKGTEVPENKKLKEKVEKAEKYLKTELGSEEKIKELLKKTDTVVVDHAANKVIKEKADQTIVQEIQETVTEEEITEVIEIQNNEGSYEKISDKITGKHKSKWTNQKKKALAWLHEQIKDEKLEKEILDPCEKIVVEKASNKKKESSWMSGWGSNLGKYITDTAKSTTEGIYQVAKHETEPKAEPGWFDNIDKIEKANDDHEIEDSRYNTQTYDFSLDDLN